MKKNLTTLAFLLLGIFQSLLAANTPTIAGVSYNSLYVKQYEKLEVTCTISGTNATSFDYDSMLVQGVFTAASGMVKTVDAFIFKINGMNATWKIRYTPTETGQLNFKIKAQNAYGNTQINGTQVSVLPPVSNGFIRKTNTSYYAFENGKQFIPVGQNMDWLDNDDTLHLPHYFQMLNKLNAHGGNFIHYAFTPWFNEIEWNYCPKYPYNYQGAKQFYLPNAERTDSILDSLAAKNMYCMISLYMPSNVYADTVLVPEWGFNPLNIHNGGPCDTNIDIFTNQQAIKNYNNRLRYINARWGFSPNIMSWEMTKEVELMTNYYQDNNTQYDTLKDVIDNWLIGTTQYLKSIDVNNHLTSTNYVDFSHGKKVLSNPIIDFTSGHFYNQDNPVPNFENMIVGGAKTFLQKYNKPFIGTEYGSYYDWKLTDSLGLQDDPHNIGIHNGLWASLFSGSYGAALNWWWDFYVEKGNLYNDFKPVSLMTEKIEFLKKDYKPVTPQIVSDSANNLYFPAENWVWDKTADSVYSIDPNGACSPPSGTFSNYLFGTGYYPNLASKTEFDVVYTDDGFFKINTGFSNHPNNLTIEIDGVIKLNVTNPDTSATYSVPVLVGKHQIKIYNSGNDVLETWGVEFTNAIAPLHVYALQSADKKSVVGWMLNGAYNWQYMRDHSQVPPPSVKNQTVIFDSLENGKYKIEWYDCSTANMIKEDTALVVGGKLAIHLDSLERDRAFIISKDSVSTGLQIVENNFNLKVYPNPFTNSTAFIFNGNGENSVLEISDVTGRTIKTISSLDAKIIWDGSCTNGLKATSGIYFYKLANKNNAQSGTLIRMGE